jgi:hypothetical protein
LARKRIKPKAYIFFGQFENLAGTAVPVRGFSQRQRRFRGVALLPEIVQAIDEQFGRDVGLFFTTESVNRFALARRAVEFALSHLDDEFEFDERAVEVVFLNLTFSATSRNVGVQERVEVLFQCDG